MVHPRRHALPGLVLLVVLGPPACKGELPEQADKSDAVADTTPDTAPLADVPAAADAGSDSAVAPDTSTPDTGAPATCPGGEGCPCTGNDTCDNGICLDTHEGRRCARACVDACPAGYSCREYGSVDGAFFCVSSHLSLCAPCDADADCQVDGIAALCLAYGDAGSFCGAPCKLDSDCPGGYGCKATASGNVEAGKQCRRNEGATCDCSPWASAKKAATTCTVTNAIGACKAARKCGADGLELCAAATPTVEVCNAEDDDCDGKVDNLAVDAKCSERAFSDAGSGDVCATDAECKIGGEACEVGVGRSSGNCKVLIGECFGIPTCSASGALICQKAKTPKAELCNGEDDDCDGEVDENFAVTLPGGASAVVGQGCGAGVCAAGKVVCKDLSTAKCSTGDKAVVETCNGADDDCDGETDEAACDDGDACTKDVCDAAKLACSHTAAVDCDDGVGCTKDVCDGKTGACGHDGAALDGDGCDDGDACTASDACKGGKCVPGAPKGCDDGNPCTDDGCEKGSGCLNKANTAGCSDGDACTAGDGCEAGKCVPGAAVKCDDGEVCTDDKCDAKAGCAVSPNAAACSDGDACTVGDGCNGGKCVPGAAVKCDDGEVCTADSCDKTLGCAHLPAQASCTDGDACTVGDVCGGGKCVAGKVAVCDDGNVCTGDSCDNAKGCVSVVVQASCTDGDVCTEGDVCDKGVCVANGSKDCGDGNACTDDSCDKAKGCLVSNNAAVCSDGDACTASDGCSGGVCKAGEPKTCPAALPCHVASCDANTGQCSTTVAADGVACGDDMGKCEGGFCVGVAAQGRKMVHVPAGAFWMGCNAAKDSACNSNANEKPQHEVALSAYWLDVHQVTVAGYAKCHAAGKCGQPTTSAGCNWAVPGREQHPVNCVDWSQSRAYCQWLGSGYDLPSEAQWEKGARGGCEHNGGSSDCKVGMRTYPWGEQTPTCEHAVFWSDNSACGQNSTWPVGSKVKGISPHGAHDMAGNVWEWVLDWYDPAYYGKSPKDDPVNSQSANLRAVRGGSWGHSAGGLRSGFRNFPHDSYGNVLGFRCARVVALCDDDDPCTTDTQDQDGKCVHTPAKDDAPCDDGSACTENDVCKSGKCVAGPAKVCPAALPCHVAACDAKTGQCSATVVADGVTCGVGKGKCEGGFCVQVAAQGRKMVHVPAGSFWMGCNAVKDGLCNSQASEKPQHEVILSAYWFDMHEVTVADYAKCHAAGQCSTPSQGPPWNWALPGKEQHPVNGVTWQQARSYCKWLGAGYDLPTEAQWEKGARGGCEHNGGVSGCQAGMRTYPYGSTPSPGCDHAVMSSAAGHGCGAYKTWPVGSKPSGASPYGAQDMAGNVWEWVLDWLASGYYGQSPKNDPVNDKSGAAKVRRGGGWGSTAAILRSAYRAGAYPDDAQDDLGFRCARQSP